MPLCRPTGRCFNSRTKRLLVSWFKIRICFWVLSTNLAMRRKKITSATYWQPFTKTEETSQWVLGLHEQLKKASDRTDAPVQLGHGRLQTCQTVNSFWLLYSFDSGGLLAIRTCFDPQLIKTAKITRTTQTTAEYHLTGTLGTFRVKIALPDRNSPLLQYTTWLEPERPFSVQAFPRDLYLLDNDYNPIPTQGSVYVQQSGPTSGITFLSLIRPEAGTLVYLQNLTALNDYCQVTQTELDGTVATQWPEAGFALPSSDQPLAAGKEVILSDAFIYLSESIPDNEFAAGDLFLEAIACIYKQLPKPKPVYYDWPKAAERTIKALTKSENCGRTIQKHYYLNAYVDADRKPPESMVQLAILVPLWEYQRWRGQPIPLIEQLEKNLPAFYDEKKAVIMRWLPAGTFEQNDRSEEQDPTKIDSWYLLHTLMNLARLAHMGHADAKDLLFKSLEFAIKAAHHFAYNWPVFYDVQTLKVVKAETSEGHGGELDVAGLYTHVMLQVYELTKETRYLDEAIASAERLKSKGFALLYQSNITIMSALTLAKLWKLTGNRLYFDLSRLSVANVVARFWIWECKVGYGQNRSTFMGVAPLKNAPYLAAYEEGEIMATILNYLKEVDQDVPESIRLLFSEYIKYVLHRGRYYFPAELTPEAVCEQPREGRIIRKLPIPLEDISTGWKKAGAVGQEVYGGALAYILATYAYTRLDSVPIVIFSDYPVYQIEYQVTGKQSGLVLVRLAGPAACSCRLRVLAKHRSLPSLKLYNMLDEQITLKPTETGNTFQDYQVRGDQHLRIEWTRKKKA